jgi:hypothetical protein
MVLEPASRADRWVSNKEDIMAKQNHGIVQDERGQDQPTSKKAAHRNEPTVPRDAREVDPRDIRAGAYDQFNDEGKPRPDHVPPKTTTHEAHLEQRCGQTSPKWPR